MTNKSKSAEIERCKTNIHGAHYRKAKLKKELAVLKSEDKDNRKKENEIQSKIDKIEKEIKHFVEILDSYDLDGIAISAELMAEANRKV